MAAGPEDWTDPASVDPLPDHGLAVDGQRRLVARGRVVPPAASSSPGATFTRRCATVSVAVGAVDRPCSTKWRSIATVLPLAHDTRIAL